MRCFCRSCPANVQHFTKRNQMLRGTRISGGPMVLGRKSVQPGERFIQHLVCHATVQPSQSESCKPIHYNLLLLALTGFYAKTLYLPNSPLFLLLFLYWPLKEGPRSCANNYYCHTAVSRFIGNTAARLLPS